MQEREKIEICHSYLKKANVNTNTEEMLNFIVPFESELENVD